MDTGGMETVGQDSAQTFARDDEYTWKTTVE